MVMGNSTILPSLHEPANAQTDVIGARQIANAIE
jgi:hypothetical protein